MGDCVSKDGRKAVELYEKAIGAGSVPAMFNLGMMYELGDGVEEDMKKAVYLCQGIVVWRLLCPNELGVDV